jgi:transcriptional regulator with XRE-family HTH domain
VTAAKLKKLRLSAGWTQAQMAAKLRMTRTGYAMYERDLRKIPGPVEIAVRCLVLHRR